MVLGVFKAGAGNLAGLVLLAISIKVLAVITGPAGVGLFSLLRNLQQVLSTIGSIGGYNAIVQTIPGLHGREREQFIVTIFWVYVSGAILLSVLPNVFAAKTALLLIGSEEAYLIRWLAIPTASGVMLFYFRAILNAHLEIGVLAWVNISIGLASILVAVPAAIGNEYFGPGALLWLLAFPLAIGATLAFAGAHKRGFLAAVLSPPFDLFKWNIVKQFARMAIPSLLAGLIGIASVLLIRSMVIRHHGLEVAGYFDAGWSIGALYLTFFLSAMQTYLLPAMSGDREGWAARELLDKALRLVTIAVVPLIAFVIILKPYLVEVFFTSDFIPALDLLRWTLLGDYLRVLGWVLATYLLARVDMVAYLFHECLWSIIFVIISVWLLPVGLAGVGKAYFLAYAAYLLSLLWRIRVRHLVRLNWRLLAVWFTGCVVILIASMVAWNAVTLDWRGSASLALAILFSWMIMRPNERLNVKRLLFKRFGFGG